MAGFFAAPSLGALAWVAWGWASHQLWPTDVVPGPLWFQLRSGAPIGYVLAACAAWPSIFFLRRWKRHSLTSFALSGFGAGVTLGAIMFVVIGLWLQFTMPQPGIDEAFWTSEWLSALPGMCLVGSIVAMPTLVAFWVAIERPNQWPGKPNSRLQATAPTADLQWRRGA